MIQITETAARKIKSLMAKQGISDGGLRVGVKGGGCSGLSYTFGVGAGAAAWRRGVRGARGRQDLRRPQELSVPQRDDARLRHGAADPGVRLPQPEREADLRLRQLLRCMTRIRFPVRLRSSALECRTCGAGAPVDEHFCPQCSRILALGRHGDYFAFLGLPRQLTIDAAGPRAPLPRAEPQVPPGLLLQRAARRAAGQPRAVVVSERRLPHAAQPGVAHRAPAGDRRTAVGEVGRRHRQGAAGAARRSVRAERGAGRDPRAARVGRRSRRRCARGSTRRGSRSSASARSTSASSQELAARWDSQEQASAPGRSARRSRRCASGCSSATTSTTCSPPSIARRRAGRLGPGQALSHEPRRRHRSRDHQQPRGLREERRAGGDPRSVGRCAGAVGGVDRRGRHGLRRPRGAAPAADGARRAPSTR